MPLIYIFFITLMATVFLFTRRVAENHGFSFFTRRVTDGHGEVVRIVVCLEISVIFRGATCECHDWMVTGSHRVFSVTTDVYFHETCPVQK